MDKHEFLKKIDSFKDCTVETRVLELYEAAEDIFEGHDDEIRDLKSDINNLDEKNDDLRDDVRSLERQVEELEKDSRFTLDGIHDNIVTELVIKSLFENLDHIPTPELEAFINKYKPN